MTVHAERPTTPQDKSRELQRRLYLRAKRQKREWPDLTWQIIQRRDYECLEYYKKKVVGEPDEGKPRVQFEVAGNGNQSHKTPGAIP